jgi:transketolase
VQLGRANPDIVVLDADLSKSTYTQFFAAEFPERFFDLGVAEQNMIGIAAGLAASGKIPFVSSFAVFVPGRCFDQIRMSVAQPGLNVKLVSTHSGISVGEDGSSHHCIEDLAMAGALPGFTVIAPADAIEADHAVRTVARSNRPCYIRLCRPKSPLIYDNDYQFKVGKAVTLKDGSDVTIIAIGLMVSEALKAADELSREGIACRVVNMPTVKPIDEAAIIQAATETGAIVTAEEHLRHGGLGSIVAQAVARNHPVPVDFVAINDTYARSGKGSELLDRYGLTARDIARSVRKIIKVKAAK